MDFIVSFLIGFVGVWLVSHLTFSNYENCKLKEPMVDIAKLYGSNEKICKELKQYSLNKIRNGNYEYMEVIDTIKRHSNDKTRT